MNKCISIIVCLIFTNIVNAEDTFSHLLQEINVNENELEIKDERVYKSKGKFPWQLKCTKHDFRTFHGCLEARFFDPGARVYFDTGHDEVDEIDVFTDGGLNVTLDFVSVYFPWRFGRAKFYDKWSWGPMLGVGLSSPAKDSPDGTTEASDAPVVLLSYGLQVEYKLDNDGASFSFELGKATGFSSDESLSDTKDTASYVGLKLNIPTAKRED